MSIFEVHLGSWRRGEDGRFLTYDELADQLIPYAADLGFTHIELLPVSEHPLDDSWGYQPIGLFAPTRRFGAPDGFARFVDRAHAAGLGVLLDWVPAHFPVDAHGLEHFDGAPLYEHADPRKGFHPDWNTAIYDFGRKEVANFLLANALYWVDRYHVDGLRVDAVASMIYLDYSRKAGEWLPNAEGGNENRDAVAFLKRVNEAVYGEFPGAMTIAEESTAYSGVSQADQFRRPRLRLQMEHGLDARYARLHVARSDLPALEPRQDDVRPALRVHRKFRAADLATTKSCTAKGSVIGKMPGDEWQRFANARAYYAFMWGHPGKKLLFMGQEFGQTSEWNCNEALALVAARSSCRIRACRSWCATSTRSIARAPRCMRAIASPKGFAGSSLTTTRSPFSPSCAWAPTATRRSRSSAISPRWCGANTASACPRGALARGAQHGLGDLWRLERRQLRRYRRRAAADAWISRLGGADLAAAGGGLPRIRPER